MRKRGTRETRGEPGDVKKKRREEKGRDNASIP